MAEHQGNVSFQSKAHHQHNIQWIFFMNNNMKTPTAMFIFLPAPNSSRSLSRLETFERWGFGVLVLLSLVHLFAGCNCNFLVQ